MSNPLLSGMRCDPKQKYLCGDQASNTDGRPWKRQAGLLTKNGQQRNFSHCWPFVRCFLTSLYATPASFFRSANGTTTPCSGATVVGSSLSFWISLYQFEMKMCGRGPEGAGTPGASGVKSSASTRIFSFGR